MMLYFSRAKIITISLICLLSIIFALPNFLPENSKLRQILPLKTINLGLDLKGGAHLLLEVDYETYHKDQLEFVRQQLRSLMIKEKLGYKNLMISSNRISFELRDNQNLSRVKRIIKDISRDLIYDTTGDIITIRFSEEALEYMKKTVLEQSIEIVRRRIDETGTREPTIQRQGDHSIILQVPGEKDPASLKNALGKTAKLTFHLVNREVALGGSKAAPAGSKYFDVDVRKNENHRNEIIGYIIEKNPTITGDLLVDARATLYENHPVISFKFNNLGAKKFGDFTRDNVGHLFAIVLDNKVISAAVVREPILSGSGIIQGNFTVESANELALLLRAGALPAPLKIIEERVIGPTLGEDSISHGKLAGAIGFVAVVVFMILTYGIYGIFASIALVINLIMLIASLSLLQATLTMPGIAGIILTIGMAVDANVLIFERIKEERKKSQSEFNSLTAGFKGAFSAIFDSNITTLLAALFLYILGVGVIRGFAVTLSLGILTSMFSAILLTRLMIVKFSKIH